MSGFTIRNKGLRDAFTGMLADNKITKPEVQNLIDQANKDGKLSAREATDLKAILKKVGDKFDADAKAQLQQFLGLPSGTGGTSGTGSTGGSGTGPVTVQSDRVSTVTDLKKVADTFKQELTQRANVFNTPEAAMTLFAEYAGRLKALATGQNPSDVDAEADKLLNAGRASPARGYDAKDTDLDSMSDLEEVARGRDPKTFEARVMGAASPAWTTTYWPSAGAGDLNQPGNPTDNLWAKSGPLDKLDTLLRARGLQAQAKALEFERKPMLGWLVGDTDRGHFIPNAQLDERDAEYTTGIDFDGDGKISRSVQVDFLDDHGDFAPVSSRAQLIPMLGTDTLTKKIVADAQGNKSVEYYRANGTKLTPQEATQVFFSNPNSDGKISGTMDASWWGFCDQVGLAGVLFKEPMQQSVVVDGVTFTKQDMLGLLTVIAGSQANGTGFSGNRYDGAPDTLTRKDGTVMRGTLLTDVEFHTHNMRRTNGDVMVLPKVDKDVQFQKLDGTVITVPAQDVAQVTREDQMDMSPMEFHETLVKWLGQDKRAAVMDRDGGAHVWNYNFWKATLKSGVELTGASRPTQPGHSGPANPNNKIMQYDMEVLLGTATNWGNNYTYWLEFDAAGKAINGGWVGTQPPDFLWRPGNATPTWTGANPRNPFVDPKLIKEIYDKFMI